jgi:hypothetical protein
VRPRAVPRSLRAISRARAAVSLWEDEGRRREALKLLELIAFEAEYGQEQVLLEPKRRVGQAVLPEVYRLLGATLDPG